MAKRLRVAQVPSDKHSFTNRAVVNEQEFPPNQIRHVLLTNSTNGRFVFTLETDGAMHAGTMGFNLLMRKWALLSTNEVVEVQPYNFQNDQHVGKITLEVDFLAKNSTTSEPYDTDEMAKQFLYQFPKQAFTVGQQIGFKFLDKKLLKITVKEMEIIQMDESKDKPATTNVGLTHPNTLVVFEKGPEGGVNLTGKSKAAVARTSIINPNWDFSSMGIGGLDREFNAIFRRAFASRVFPPEFIEQLGLKHVRGILLYGPPGTGKTLMARQIGKMLNSREPKIVNGPQILDKYVGESEANIRKLFADAEEEFKRMGNNSGLHIIIFDEIDAICKARGSVAGASGVHDTVVNQLLAKIDGVDSLNNILVIGMTNRRDMIDEALLRPGRLEVQMEISLPNEFGRCQILEIHTVQMKQYKKMAEDVDLKELAAKTKNFSGAEIEGLVRAAQSTAMNRLVKATSKVEVDSKAIEKLLVTREDFLHALENDVKPAFGTSAEQIERLITGGIIHWGAQVASILEDGDLFIRQARAENASRGLVTILLEGAPNTGKTALAAYLAIGSDFPFVKLCSPDDMVGYTESAKCLSIKKVFDDAYKSPLSCILVDNIERLLDYAPIGPRYSNLVLQALLVLLKREPPQGKKLFVICTTSRRDVLEEMEMIAAFTSVIRVPMLSEPIHLLTVLAELSKRGDTTTFNPQEQQEIGRLVGNRKVYVGIKKLFGFIDMARQMDMQNRVFKFVTKLEDERCIE